MLIAAGGSSGRPANAARAGSHRAARATGGARRAPRVVEAVAAVTNAEAVTPQLSDLHLFPLAVFGAVIVGGLLAIRLRRELGSYTLPWGTGSTSTRGPPTLQLA